MRGGVGHRFDLDPALLWLWCRPSAIAPTGPQACEFPHATDVALQKAKKKKLTSYFVTMVSMTKSATYW